MTGYVRFPNWVDEDHRMYDSTKKLLFAMVCAAQSGSLRVRKSQEELASLSGLSRNTVRRALRELEQRGIVHSTRRYCYSRRLGRVVRAKSSYRLLGITLGGYTLLPRKLLEPETTPAEFVVALHLYRLSGRQGRCYPSLRHIARQIDHGKATVCRAVRRLQLRQIVSRLHCTKRCGAFSCNSYYPIGFVRRGTYRRHCAAGGGLKFAHHPGMKKTTEGFYSKGDEQGVGQFGEIDNSGGLFPWFRQLYFDGTGVVVSMPDEQDDILG